MAKKIEIRPQEDAMKEARQAEIFDYLKDNLRIVVNNSANREYDYDSKYISISTCVELYLTNPTTKEEVKISSESSSDSFSMKDR